MMSPNKGSQTLFWRAITQNIIKSTLIANTIGNPNPKFANHGCAIGCSLSTFPIRNRRMIATILATETSL